ncbi:MAG: bifunctional UDP-N-acetylglucosamine diphosphorylase/glucosamine-1-phosphate N-acetyltransferase GlmU [Gammaproteobacteria bacterium]|nr:bifunctional UDP-N-acetylglucosamine diphosphorylase/glucosamine-1-phosphate N-acetyltransferase GlmU [Gammaproteobacteria bacterium]
MALTVLILAAGQGKRMNSDRPKVLQPLGGRPLLAHVVDTARALGAEAINIVYGHGAEDVQAAFPDADLEWTLQAEQLGTGHAVAQALPAIPPDHAVLVLCGDAPLVAPESLESLLKSVPEKAVGLLTARLVDPSGYGRVVRDDTGRITGIVEERDATPEQRKLDEINTGVMVLPAQWLADALEKIGNDNSQGEYYLTDVIALAVAENREIAGSAASDPSEVLGINDRTQLASAERIFQRRNAQRLFDQGVTLADPERFDLRGKLDVGRDVFIDVGAVFEGDVVLGDRVHIGPNAVVSNSRLGDDCIVHAHCVIDGLVAGPRCEIGPFARLRPGVTFVEQVKVGNFVEVKASEVGAGSKINHLTYVGDSSVGRDVNIGAGTITCNYDGANKHRTTIGDRVFVGSGVMLVAPVHVGEGATIAAGSTITREAPAEELSIERSKQKSVKGWKRPEKTK